MMSFLRRLAKVEAKEATGAGSSGAFEAPIFSEPVKNTLVSTRY